MTTPRALLPLVCGFIFTLAATVASPRRAVDWPAFLGQHDMQFAKPI